MHVSTFVRLKKVVVIICAHLSIHYIAHRQVPYFKRRHKIYFTAQYAYKSDTAVYAILNIKSSNTGSAPFPMQENCFPPSGKSWCMDNYERAAKQVQKALSIKPFVSIIHNRWNIIAGHAVCERERRFEWNNALRWCIIVFDLLFSDLPVCFPGNLEREGYGNAHPYAEAENFSKSHLIGADVQLHAFSLCMECRLNVELLIWSPQVTNMLRKKRNIMRYLKLFLGHNSNLFSNVQIYSFHPLNHKRNSCAFSTFTNNLCWYFYL